MDLSLFDSLQVGAIQLRANGDMTYANDFARRLMGASENQFNKGLNFFKIMSLADTELLSPEALRKVSSATPYFETAFKNKRGEEGLARISVQPCASKEFPDSFLLYLFDISLETTLYEKYKKHQDLYSISSDEAAAAKASYLRVDSILERKVAELTFLLDFANETRFEPDANSIVRTVLEMVTSRIGFEYGFFLRHTEDRKTLEIGDFEQLIKDSNERSPELYSSFSIKDFAHKDVEEMFIFETSEQNPSIAQKHSMALQKEVKNVTTLPLKVGGKVIGFFQFINFLWGAKLAEEARNLLNVTYSEISRTFQSIDLYNQTITDELTKVYNSRYFRGTLPIEIKRAESEGKTLGLLMCDIDHFKKFNDTYGHQTGDLVLKEVAQCLKSNNRRRDKTARYGGEEFGIIVPDATPDGLEHKAERLRTAIEHLKIQTEHGELKVTMSFGGAIFPEQALTSSGLIERADMALYKSKEKGRNCFTLFSMPS